MQASGGGRHVRALPLLGLAVMLAAGVLAGPYTPSWFDGTQPCTRSSAPCPADVDPQLALRALSWAAWGGLVLVLGGVALVASLLTGRDVDPTEPSAEQSLHTRRSLAHAGVAGGVTAIVVAVGAGAAFMAALAASSQLAAGVAVGAWLGLARVLELAHGRLGRARGAATAYLLALAVAGLSCLAMATVIVTWEADAWWAAVGVAGLVGALATGAGDTVAWDRQPAARTVGGVVVAAAAVITLAGSLSLLGLLRPLDRPTEATDRTDTMPPPVRPQEPPPARPTGPPTPSASPTTASPGVRTGRRCSADDVRLGLTGFDAAMGARVATLEAVNLSGSPCYLDGFATVALSRGRSALAVTSGTTSTSQPGMPGRATRVGLAPRGTARAVLYWRGYGAAADTTTPQTLTVTLRPGTSGQRVAVEPWAFDLADGGELRVGNWVLAG